MKKVLISLFLAGAMMVSLVAGCSKNEEKETKDEPNAPEVSEEKEEKEDKADGETKEVVLIIAIRDEWLSELEKGANDNIPAGVNLTTQDAQNDASKQLQYVEAAHNSGVAAIIVNMVDPSTAEVIKEAANGTPLVFVNRYPTDDSVLDENCIYVGSDETTSGAFQGKWLAEYFKAQDKTEINYVLLNGTLGQTSTTLRTESVLKALKDNGITANEANAPLACDYDRAKAMDSFAPLIGVKDFDCVISNNDAMALGVVEALEQKGKDPDEKPIVGIDASKDGREAIKEGKIAMSVFQDPVGQGKGSIVAAVNLANGDDISKDSGFEKDDTGFVLWVPFEKVTKDNVAEYDAR